MKCRVCGYEFSNSKPACPMCGTRNTDFFGSEQDYGREWNTRSIPRPNADGPSVRERWYSPELGEGYVSVPEKNNRSYHRGYSAEEGRDRNFDMEEYENAFAAAKNVSFEAAQQRDFSENSDFNSDRRQASPYDFKARAEKSYTFRDKNEEFQRLLGKEFDRINRNQKEAREKKKEQTMFNQKPVLTESLSKYSALFGDPDNKNAAFAAQKPKRQRPLAPRVEGIPELSSDQLSEEEYNPDEFNLEALLASVMPKDGSEEKHEKAEAIDFAEAEDKDFDLNYLDKSIEQFREEEEAAKKESEERRKKLEAMAAARDAYLKAISGNGSGEDETFGFNKEKGITKKDNAEDEGAVEELSLEELISEIKTDKNKEFTITIDPSGNIKGITSPLSLESLAGMLASDPVHTEKFDREMFIAAQKEELKRMEEEAEADAETEAFFAEFEEPEKAPQDEAAEDALPEAADSAEVSESEAAAEDPIEVQEEFSEEVKTAEEEIEAEPEEAKKVYEPPVIEDFGGPVYSNFEEELSFGVLSTETPDIPTFGVSLRTDDQPKTEKPEVHIPEAWSEEENERLKKENAYKFGIPDIDVDKLFDSLSQKAFSDPNYILGSAEQPKAAEQKFSSENDELVKKTVQALEKMTEQKSAVAGTELEDASPILEGDVETISGFIFNEPSKPHYSGSSSKVFDYTFDSLTSDAKRSANALSEKETIEKVESKEKPPVWDVLVNSESFKAELYVPDETDKSEFTDAPAAEQENPSEVLMSVSDEREAVPDEPEEQLEGFYYEVPIEEPEDIKIYKAPSAEKKAKKKRGIKKSGARFLVSVLKILGVALCFVVGIQLIVWLLGIIAPDAGFVKVLLQIKDAIQEAIRASMGSIFN